MLYTACIDGIMMGSFWSSLLVFNDTPLFYTGKFVPYLLSHLAIGLVEMIEH